MQKPKFIVNRYGGKTKMASWIVSKLPAHKCYVEPFAGSLAVLFKKEQSENEIVNDKDKNLIRVYETIRKYPQELAALLYFTPHSNANTKDVQWSEDDLEFSRQYIAKRQQLFNGCENTSTYGCEYQGGPKIKAWKNFYTRVLPAAERLRNVCILCEDYQKTLNRVKDKKDVIVYCDPPYRKLQKERKGGVYNENDYDYYEFIEIVKSMNCNIAISEYDYIKEDLKDWNHHEYRCLSTAATSGFGHRGTAREKLEILACNY